MTLFSKECPETPARRHHYSPNKIVFPLRQTCLRFEQLAPQQQFYWLITLELQGLVFKGQTQLIKKYS